MGFTMTNKLKLIKSAIHFSICISLFVLASSFSNANAQAMGYLFGADYPDQPGYEIQKTIHELLATGMAKDSAIDKTIQNVLAPESTNFDNAVKQAIALDMSLSKQFLAEMIAANSLVDVTKTLSENYDQKIETLVMLAVTLYPQYVQDIADGILLSGIRSSEEILILMLEAGVDPSSISDGTAAGSPASETDELAVVLGVTKDMRIPGPAGEFRVWIGSAAYQASFPARLAQAVKSLFVSPEFIAARVTPYAPDFDITPERTLCIKLDSSGSEVRFTLTPKKTGTFYVAAQVELFTQADCSDSPFPKYSTDLEVLVSVGSEELAEERKKEFGAVFWEKLLEFWGALLALLFGLILFVIRGKLKKLFGFDPK